MGDKIGDRMRDMTSDMTIDSSSRPPVLVAGGGIGGLAAALALVRQGFKVKVLEQAPEIGEIGAGIQLGPNAFHAFDALGVGDKARSRAVFTDCMVMHDALDEPRSGSIPTGEAFRQRFGNPYAVIHRVDVHLSAAGRRTGNRPGGIPHLHAHGAGGTRGRPRHGV
jgi:2-polyprenyl-6-methoxyphenol hydroxylase-like FAD-dependent oxidoreductase